MEGSCEHGNEPSGYVKMLGNSRVAERLAVSEEGLGSMELVKTCISVIIIFLFIPVAVIFSTLCTSK
jgi:hypothetical protein